jgi:D-glycero-alpha-D-manno-heptose-7-phosphate kinase
MIISRTPFRVSLLGGGTDFPQWYLEHGGAVLAMAINRYAYLSVRFLPPFFEHKHRVCYSEIETINSIDQIRHPSVRAVMSEMSINDGMEIHYNGDLPARSGLGSSSAFTVGLLNALNAQYGRMINKEDLAREAIRIEQDVIKEAVGSQDQIICAHGGFNRVDFHRDGGFVVRPIVIQADRKARLVSNLMLFFTGLSRFASEIEAEKIRVLKQRSSELLHLRSLVEDAQAIICGSGDLDGIGEILHDGWMTKRGLTSAVSNERIDTIYAKALAAGAKGGKLLGAGGGGFILFYVPPDRQDAVRASLSELIEVSFDIDGAGSSIVVYEPNGLNAR